MLDNYSGYQVVQRNREKTVIHLVEDMNVGGLEEVVATIAKNVDKHKYKVIIWCMVRGGEIADELKKNWIDIRILGITNYYNPINILKLTFLLKSYKPTIIHTHTYFTNTIGRIAAIAARIPTIITHVHNTYWHYKARHRIIERLLSKYTDKVICCSNAVKNFVLQKERIAESKVETIYYGIVVDKFTKRNEIKRPRRNIGINERDLIITTVASLTDKKGHKYALRAIREISRVINNIKYLIVGDGPLKETLMQMVIELEIDENVIFAGKRRDVSDLLNITDIFLLPSIIEGFGIALIEAMAASVPIVATNVGGVSEIIIDGTNGILVPPRDWVEITYALSALLTNSKKAQEIGTAGHLTCIKKFYLDQMINKIEELYEGCSK